MVSQTATKSSSNFVFGGRNDINSESGTIRVEDLCPTQQGKELLVFVVTNRIKDGLGDTGHQ